MNRYENEVSFKIVLLSVHGAMPAATAVATGSAIRAPDLHTVEPLQLQRS